jgi:hypothetical protein
MFKNILKINKIQEFDQCQKTPKGTQSLCAGVVSCGRPDFVGPSGVMRKSFTKRGFIDMLFSLLNHLGYLLPHRMFFTKPTIAGNPDGFLFYSIRCVQNSGINLTHYIAGTPDGACLSKAS